MLKKELLPTTNPDVPHIPDGEYRAAEAFMAVVSTFFVNGHAYEVEGKATEVFRVGTFKKDGKSYFIGVKSCGSDELTEQEAKNWNYAHPEFPAKFFEFVGPNGKKVKRLVTPKIEGERAEEALSKAMLANDDKTLLKMYIAILQEIVRLHKMRMIHRDPHFGNMFIQKNEKGEYRAFAIDFGRAKIVSEIDQYNLDVVILLTLFGPLHRCKYLQDFLKNAIREISPSANILEEILKLLKLELAARELDDEPKTMVAKESGKDYKFLNLDREPRIEVDNELIGEAEFKEFADGDVLNDLGILCDGGSSPLSDFRYSNMIKLSDSWSRLFNDVDTMDGAVVADMEAFPKIDSDTADGIIDAADAENFPKINFDADSMSPILCRMRRFGGSESS